MSKVYADAVATPEPTDDLTLGASGDNVIIPAGATLKTNTLKDSGGNTIFTSDGSGTLSNVMTQPRRSQSNVKKSRFSSSYPDFKVPPHSPSDKVLGDFTKSLLRYLILKLVICVYLLYLLEHFLAFTNT